MADAILTQRGAPDFIDASDVSHAAIRHVPSGLTCALPAEGAFEFDVFPAEAPNSGAHCSNTVGDVANAWVVVQFREPTTLDIAFANAVNELVGPVRPQQWEGRPSEADRSSPEGLPHYRIYRFVADYGDASRYMRLAVSEVDGWYLQQIVSAPITDADEAERQAGEAWRAALRDFVSADRPPPPRPGN